MLMINASPVKAPTARGAELIDKAPLEEVLVGWEEVEEPVREVAPLLELPLLAVPVDDDAPLVVVAVELPEVVVGKALAAAAYKSVDW